MTDDRGADPLPQQGRLTHPQVLAAAITGVSVLVAAIVTGAFALLAQNNRLPSALQPSPTTVISVETITLPPVTETQTTALPRETVAVGLSGETSDIRRSSTPGQPVRLGTNYGIDLDSMESNWGVAEGYAYPQDELDLLYSPNYSAINVAERLAVVEAGATERTCAEATQFDNTLRLSDLELPATACIVTTSGRYSIVTVQEYLKGEYVSLDVTTYE